ncbi:protein cereblon-like [Gigantopelta aegis]|uniref:protein cereblon-like n=1 Tax=Gigantopelta aegis TaxID=1735272 RepID=UPI001B887EE8|nr:protein cereblon-like [Gigantopelta aegis]
MATAMKPVNFWDSLSVTVEILSVILFVNIVYDGIHVVAHELQGGFLLCRHCGYDVASSSHILSVPSKLAHRQRNDTIAQNKGVLIQLFKNPQETYFEVIASSQAEVKIVGNAYSEDSWFPGYRWTICVCPRCNNHLGWVFDTAEPERKPASFVGLILNNLLHETEAESIIAAPKAYAS